MNRNYGITLSAEEWEQLEQLNSSPFFRFPQFYSASRKSSNVKYFLNFK